MQQTASALWAERRRGPNSIGLNVSGTIFLTDLATLTSRGPNAISCMIENDRKGVYVFIRHNNLMKVPRRGILKDEEGNYVINRRADLFQYILLYLYTHELRIASAKTRLEVIREMDRFAMSIPSFTN